MIHNRLNVVNNNSAPSRAEQLQAHFDQLWTNYPEQFDPTRNSMEKERIERTWFLIQKYHVPHCKAVDLGCGTGPFSLRLQTEGAHVTAVDISPIPLNILKHKSDMEGGTPIETLQACLPHTILNDNSYDLVICTDVIAFLERKQHRLLLSELCRLLKPEGRVICSTPLDIRTENPLEDFAALIETEFTPDGWILSSHFLYIKLQRLLDAPSSYWKSYCSPTYLAEQLAHRTKWRGRFYRLNTFVFPAVIWRAVSCLLIPINHLLHQRKWTLIFLEKISKFFWGERAVSHAIFVGHRKPIKMETGSESAWNPPLRKETKWE
jgi:2-polyprenyl-3-methyl-5-hydroxy-6-metoxy-1,4-benzoquinol methylase